MRGLLVVSPSNRRMPPQPETFRTIAFGRVSWHRTCVHQRSSTGDIMRNFIGLLGAGIFGWLASSTIPFWAAIVLAPIIFLFTRWLATLALGAFLYSQLSDEQKQSFRQLEPRAEPANTRQPSGAQFRGRTSQQGKSVQKPRIDAAAQAAMTAHDITFEGGQFVFRTYRYEKLDDAVNYARLVAQRELG